MEESDSEAFSGVNLVSVTMAMSDLLRAAACWKAQNFDSSPKALIILSAGASLLGMSLSSWCSLVFMWLNRSS